MGMAFGLQSFGLFHVIVLLSIVAIPIYSRSIPLPIQFPPLIEVAHKYVPRQNGNSTAAGDLYGIGLRVGAYLQIFGMLLSCTRTHKRSRLGLKLISASVCFSILCSWIILVSHRIISPCEAWLILSLTNAYSTPRLAAINDAHKKSGGIATLFCAVAVITQDVLMIWFFTTLCRTLPLLGTNNRVWFFTSVDVTGWFRILMLVYSCVMIILLPFEIVAYISLGMRKFMWWAEGVAYKPAEPVDQHAAQSPSRFQKLTITVSTAWSKKMNSIAHALDNFLKSARNYNIIRSLIHKAGDRLSGLIKGTSQKATQTKLTNIRKYVRRTFCVTGFVILILTVAGVEKIIEYNNLSPQTDLSQPGQIIPFILGIIAILEGIGCACMPLDLNSEKGKETVPLDDLCSETIIGGEGGDIIAPLRILWPNKDGTLIPEELR